MSNRKIHEELQRHVHGDLMKSINEAIIGIKLHHIPSEGESAIQQAKISEARRNHHCPTWQEIVELLQQTHREISDCQAPYKRY